MKYLLFISFNSGLKHNAVYESLPIVRESLQQLVGEEGLNSRSEYLSGARDLEKHLFSNDDYEGCLSNGTWFHIQKLCDKNYIKDDKCKK